jgi:hypothetical protein
MFADYLERLKDDCRSYDPQWEGGIAGDRRLALAECKQNVEDLAKGTLDALLSVLS